MSKYETKKNELTSDMQSVTISPVLCFCEFHKTVAFFFNLMCNCRNSIYPKLEKQNSLSHIYKCSSMNLGKELVQLILSFSSHIKTSNKFYMA